MLNRTIIMGRLTADPELRHTAGGKAVSSFSLAVEREGQKDENGKRAADFIDCVAWQGTAELVCRFFSKGRMAVCEGQLRTRRWEDKQGAAHKSTELIVSSIYFGDSKKPAEGSAGAKNETGDGFEELCEDDGDLPF